MRASVGIGEGVQGVQSSLGRKKRISRRRGRGVGSRGVVVMASQTENEAKTIQGETVSSVSAGKLDGRLTVAVTGATGFVGNRLTAALLKGGNKVHVLTRDAGKARSKFPDPRVSIFGNGRWQEGIYNCDAVVNLAGEPISTRWTPEIKSAIRSSRLGATRKVVEAINAAIPGDKKDDGSDNDTKRPLVLVSGSALGYYGASQTEEFTESSSAGDDYLARVCQEWEGIAKEAQTRVVLLRTGIVLGSEGGALSRMLPIFKLYAGGPVGTGTQWFSWIHIDDHIDLIMDCIRKGSIEGPVNGTAPSPVTMGEMCSSLGRIVGRPSWLPVPEFALKALLGEGAAVVLEGQRVIPEKAIDCGFEFKYKDIGSALSDICK